MGKKENSVLKRPAAVPAKRKLLKRPSARAPKKPDCGELAAKRELEALSKLKNLKWEPCPSRLSALIGQTIGHVDLSPAASIRAAVNLLPNECDVFATLRPHVHRKWSLLKSSFAAVFFDYLDTMSPRALDIEIVRGQREGRGWFHVLKVPRLYRKSVYYRLMLENIGDKPSPSECSDDD